MNPEFGDNLFDPGADVLGSSQDARGVVLVQTGDAVSPETIADGAELWQHVGFCSRPAKAIAGKSACQVLALKQGGPDLAIATRDARCSLPAGLGEGETCLYAGGPGNAGTGQIRLSDDGSTATIKIQLRKGNGSAGAIISIQIGSDGAITIDAGGSSKITVDETGIKLGATASIPVALATPLDSFITQLLVALTTGTTPPGGGAVAFVGLPTAPTIASSVVKAQT